ncbi:globin domain-containing protein [Kitasatospora sp. GAS204B]|uniref:globin domain-containing protein n=1 Tax=unclassified Kitasatospora TaxID=2633591 RepID=UPI002476BF18|nr:globin domain-containing protein [Kitasatospora sp. GAS204B]MDH6122660.1 NAD(P)H-flavin reductase/hemoglobin-like flavoprotein [Kitasatospora sp. GAS204B]
MKFRAKRAAGEVRKPSIPESGWQPPLPQPAVVPPQRPVPAGGAVLPSNSAQSANAPTAGPFAPQPAPVDQAANDSALIRASLSVVEPHAANLPGFFYATLFGRYPQVRELFPPDMDVQHDRLLRALLMIVDLVDDPANLARFCEHLGRDHRKFGTESAHYAAVGECLLATLAHYAGPAWNAGTAAAWSRAYTTVAEVMDQAARADAAIRPAVWGAQIVAHHRHGDEIAELTVRTDQPYPFVGGQYVSVATPWWPKLWRYLSPANAPRPDGTITFHVQQVPGGRVSGALVQRAAVGDVLQLGAPQGDMVLDPASARDIVCIAGGTGLAPIRALVEQAALNGLRRRVDVFLGARTAAGLYGLDDLLRMSQRHRWLTVRAAVADQEARDGAAFLPKVLADSGPWKQHDAYLSGPAPMIVTAARVLARGGVPLHRIHHDPFVALDDLA